MRSESSQCSVVRKLLLFVFIFYIIKHRNQAQACRGQAPCVCLYNTQSISSQLISLDVQQCSNEALCPAQRETLGQSPTDLSTQLLFGHENCFVGAHWLTHRNFLWLHNCILLLNTFPFYFSKIHFSIGSHKWTRYWSLRSVHFELLFSAHLLKLIKFWNCCTASQTTNFNFDLRNKRKKLTLNTTDPTGSVSLT